MENSTTDRPAGPSSGELIRYTWYRTHSPRSDGFILAADEEFPVEAAMYFAEAMGVADTGTVIVPNPTVPTWRENSPERKAHPLLTGHRSRWGHANGLVRTESTYPYFSYLVATSFPRYVLDDTSRTFNGWFHWDGDWRRIDYEPMRASCVLIEEAFHPNSEVCAKCSMRGEQCIFRVQRPFLERVLGEEATEYWLTNTEFRFPDTPSEIFEERPPPDGFEKVTHFEAREDAGSVIPRTDSSNAYPRKMRLSSQALAANRDAKATASAKGAATRKQRGLVCGLKGEECHFKSANCNRWRSYRYSTRKCQRRWDSGEELLENMLENYDEKHSTAYDEDIKFAYHNASMEFRVFSPNTGRELQAVYRGLVRNRGEYVHEIYGSPGSRARRIFRGSYDDMLRWLRRNAPDVQLEFRGRQADASSIEDEARALVLCIAEYTMLSGKVCYSTSFYKDYDDKYQAEMSSTGSRYVCHGFEWFALNYRWPPYADP